MTLVADPLTMAVVDQALANFWSLVAQWKNGQCAQFVLSCENGNLTVKTSVNLGSWTPPNDADSRGRLRKAGPRRHRRREKRAAARVNLSYLSPGPTKSPASSESPASPANPEPFSSLPPRPFSPGVQIVVFLGTRFSAGIQSGS